MIPNKLQKQELHNHHFLLQKNALNFPMTLLLTLELLMAKRKLAYWKMTGRILVGDEVAMEAEISAAETKQ